VPLIARLGWALTSTNTTLVRLLVSDIAGLDIINLLEYDSISSVVSLVAGLDSIYLLQY